MNKIEVMSVEMPEFKDNAVRLVLSVSGLILAVLGVLMMMSIILILPGIGALLLGLVIAILTVPKADVICPACESDNKTPLKSKKLRCDSCETVTPLKWKKP